MGNYDHIIVLVSFDFLLNSKEDVPFHRIAWDYCRADGNGLRDHLRDVPWDDIFKLCVSPDASEFCEWVEFVTDVCISHRKYQVTSYLSPWLLAVSAAAIGAHFLRWYQQNKSSESKVKFRQAGNCCKKVLEATKLT